MRRALIVRKIQNVLNASGLCDNGADIAVDYATVVNLLNCRIETSKNFLYQGQLGEAIRIAEERPSLFETCEMLSFDRLPMWQNMCQLKGWPEAEEIKKDLLAILQEAFSSPKALEPLIELHRVVTRAQDLRMAVRCLRRIVKLDKENKKWISVLDSFEEHYLKQLKDQFFSAAASKTRSTMHRVAEEIEAGLWNVAMDTALLSAIADMRKEEVDLLNTSGDQVSEDRDPFQAAPDDEVKPVAAEPELEVTTTRIDSDHRVAGWTPSPKMLLIACLILTGLFLVGVTGLFWFGKEHYRKACEGIITDNSQMLEERCEKEFIELKGELEKGRFKETYKPLRDLVKREKDEIIVERRNVAEKESARKLAEESVLEHKKAEEVEAERIRLLSEKRKKEDTAAELNRKKEDTVAELNRKKEEEAAAELKRKEEDLRLKAAERQRMEALEAERKMNEVIAAERKRAEQEELRKIEAAADERKRLEELERKKAEELAALQKRTEEVNLLQNSGFDSSLYMVIDVSGGTSATQYSVSYYPTAGDVPGGILGDDYKTTKILLRYIAPGVFMMGSPREQLGYDESQPPREMSVTNGFFMGVFEVTQHQWELVMGNNPSYYEDASASNSRPVEQVSCYEIRENAKTNKDDPDSNWPANNFVNDNSFMGKLRLKTGIRSFDLPTEIQWEYASRAGTTTALNSGKNITNMYIDSNVAEVARYYSNGGRGYKRDGTTLIMTAPVGSYRPNAWGLYDMHGNVSEWCLDWRCLYPASAPKWKGAEQANYSVLRGGGWDNVAWHCLVTSRTVSKPFQRSYNSGFRLVRNKAAKTEFNR
jgi:formylglycine-generating enzyme required for sulfatase activity